MATNIEIKRYNSSADEWNTIYPKANWNNIDNKPSTFTPSAHSHTPRSIGVVPIYRYGTQGTTTKIKININSTAYWMLCFTVTLYQSYRATKIMISGYNYGYGGQYWYQPEARILGDSDGNETITVYFGYDSARNLWVGFDGGDYTGVSINDITNGYDQLDHFDELFTISNVSSLSTIQTTITAGSKANYSNNSGKLNGQEASYYLNYNNLTNKPTIPDISGKVDNVISLSNNVDLNTIVKSGFYRINGGTTSHGFPSAEWSQMIVSKGEDTITQIGFPYNSQYVYFRNGVISNNQISGDWTRLANASEIPSVPSWALAANKPSYTFSGTAVTSGANSGSAVAAVTAINAGSGGLEGNTTASGGIPYVEASLNGTELTLTVKYLHHSHTGASVKTTANAAPNSHTHSVTAAGSVS